MHPPAHPTIPIDPFDAWLPDIAAITAPTALQLEPGAFSPFRPYQVTGPDLPDPSPEPPTQVSTLTLTFRRIPAQP